MMGDPVRVVHVVVAGAIGGAERMLIDLASAPRHSGAIHTVALMTPNPALAALFGSAELDVVDHGPIREHPVAFLARSFGRRAVAWLRSLFRARGTQIVHLHTFASQVVGTRAALRAGLPVVRTEHSTRVFEHPACWPFARWSLQRCAAAACVSSAVHAVAAARAPWARSRLRVIRNGIDLARFSSPAGAPPAAPLALALVGRLEPRKGVDLALRALAQVTAARLDIVGDGPLRSDLERLAHQLGLSDRVRFHGHVGDVRPLLARAHAVLCSSRREGLGLALLEAMAMARPVLGFAVGGVVEIVAHDQTGLLTQDATPRALAALIERAVRRPEQLVALGRAARAWTETHASSRAMCEAYGRLYAELVQVR
jgi:glycosyltransferase involved in cell wall biosynthesis